MTDPANPLSCFVVMPFSETRHKTKDKEIIRTERVWTSTFNNWIKKAVEAFPGTKIDCQRSPAKSGNFVKGIVHSLASADIVIAELTGNKINCYYELGMRHTFRPGTIMITQCLHDVASDLRSYYCFEYAYRSGNRTAYAKFEKELHEKIASLLKDKFPDDSPARDFLIVRSVTEPLDRKKIQEACTLFGRLSHNLWNQQENSKHVRIVQAWWDENCLSLPEPIRTKMRGAITDAFMIFDLRGTKEGEQAYYRVQEVNDLLHSLP